MLILRKIENSSTFSLLQSTIEGVDNEIEAVKAEIWARISKKSQLLEKQIELLGKIRELDMMHDGDDNNTGSNPQQQEYPNFPVQSHSLMVSGNFASQPTELVVGYFEQFGRIIKLTDKSGYRVNSKTGYRFVFLKYDRVEAVDMAVGE